MHYVSAKLEMYQEELMYRVYVTDCLKGLTGAKWRYYDMISEDKTPKKSSEQIKSEIFEVFKKLEVSK